MDKISFIVMFFKELIQKLNTEKKKNQKQITKASENVNLS